MEVENSKEEDKNAEVSPESTLTKSENTNSETAPDCNEANSLNNDLSKSTFKKPMLLIGPRKGHPTKVRTLQQGAAAEIFSNVEEETNETKNQLLTLAKKAEKSKEPVESFKDNYLKKISFPYQEPAWGGVPDKDYKLEVLKSGLILETIDLSKLSVCSVGRLPTCDITMAHTSISRYHAVFQYRAKADENNDKGLYIYDLGSTHGTFWNGNRIKPKVYVRLHGGHMIKFGCSHRKFIVIAPSEDQEQESEYSLTELKEMRRQELEERERLEKQRLLEEEEAERLRKEKEENEGIDWGMGEDADEESDLTENPYAQTNNEELFLDDPKKTLRGWFEREGYDLQYQTEDKGIGKFLCWVELPIDPATGRTTRAEAVVTGKKKEAVIQCALEACRILDRHGVLRQATHEGRKRKSRNWEEEDFYDSDEDNFLDRTGTIEKKREQRMRQAGKLETKAETYDSLLEKLSKVADKIESIEKAIALQKKRREEANDSNEDALDAFMSTLDTSSIDKTEIRKMKIDLINLRKEETQLLKLINIAKPANLPALKPHVPTIAKKPKEEFEDMKSIIGNKKKLKASVKKSETQINTATEEKAAENESEEEINDETQKRLSHTEENEVEEIQVATKNNEAINKSQSLEPAENLEKLASESKVESKKEDLEEPEKNISKKKSKNLKRNQQRLEKAAKEWQKDYNEDEFREDYDMWVPPKNQSGDGKTSLNEKFGY